MGKGKDILIGAGCAFAGLIYVVMGILGLLIHLWTILIAFNISGIFAALISLVAPLFAEAYWFFVSWGVTGTPFNTYGVAIMAYAGLWVVFVLLTSFFGNKMDDQSM